MTKQEILAASGYDNEADFYNAFPTQEAFQMAMGGMVEGYKKGGWIQKATASIKKRGTEGVCTGSKFGGPSCRPGTKRYALAKTFRKMAKARKKEDGGMVEMYEEGGKLPEGVLRARLESHMSPAEASNYIANYKQGGVVDVYQLMGMPTPSMYGMGGTTNIGDLSHVISAKNFPNMGMGYGGQVPMYDFGSVVKDIGAGAYGAGSGLLNVLSMGATKGITNAGYEALQDLGNSTPEEERQQDSIRGYGQAAGAITGAVINPGSTMTAIQEGAEGVGRGVSAGSPDSKLAQGVGTYLPMAGNMVGMAGGMGAFGTPSAGAMSKSAEFGKSGFGQFAQGAGKVGKGYNQFGSMMGGDPMAMFGMVGSGYAMGGPVNGPNLLQVDTGNMPKFAMGGMTGKPTIINVEDGELLIDPKTNKILTKYLGGGMVRHPKYGQDIRGNVPVQTDDENPKFVIPVKYADKFVKARKNNNTLEMEMYKNNITIEKAKNEAKDAQIAAAEEQKANKAMNRMMAKYGGTIRRMYAQGGMVPMYNEGAGVTGPRVAPFFNFPNYQGTYPDQAPYMMEGNESWGSPANMTNPVTGMANYISGLSPAQATPMMGRLPSSINSQPAATDTLEYRYFNNPGPMNIAGDTTDYFDEGNVPGALALMQQQHKMSPSNFNQMARTAGTSNFDFSSQPVNKSSNNFNYKDFMSQAIPYGVAASQVLEPLLQKPFKMNSQDYETPADLKARLLEGERGRREMRGAQAQAVDNARQLGGSNVLAGLQAGSTAYQRNIADYEEALENKNRMIQSDVDRANKTIQQGNLNQRMQMAMFNEQNRAARRNAIRQGVMNVAGTYYNQQANQMTKQALSAGYPDYQFPWNKKKSS